MRPIFVEVPILCYDGSSNIELEETLGIKLNESDTTEVRIGYIDLNKLIAFYPRVDASTTIIELGNDMYVLDLTVEELLEIINTNI